MPDLDQIKQGKQGAWGLARAASQGQVEFGRAVAATTSTVTREGAGCGLLQIRC
jgi:hypothetical protein